MRLRKTNQAENLEKNETTLQEQLKELHISDKCDADEEYLYLPNIDHSHSSYFISMIPTNSTGDIYHILSYLILAQAENKKIPQVLLTYDGNETLSEKESSINTYTQVMRSLFFVDALGQKKYFKPPVKLETGNCGRVNHRNAVLLEYLATLQPFVHCIDQKALTVLLAFYIRNNGKDTFVNHLRKGYTQFNSNIAPPEVMKNVTDKTTQQIDAIKKYAGNDQLIILHLRHSSKANSEQNPESLSFIESMKNYLEEKKFKVWFIFADGRMKGSFKNITSNRTDVFPFEALNSATGIKKDFGKIYHVRLLHDLYGLNNLLGIIGNTSGTLDLAGFLGHQVYNIHQFNSSMNCQAYRILIQTSFLSLDFLIKNKKTAGSDLSRRLPNLPRWLARENGDQNLTPLINENPVKKDFRKSEYMGLFFVQNTKTKENIPLPCKELIIKQLGKAYQRGNKNHSEPAETVLAKKSP